MDERTRLEAILDECVTAVLERGGNAHDCLAHYPEQRAVLEPLLHLGMRLQGMRNLQPAPTFRGVAAVRMQNLIAAHPRQPVHAWDPPAAAASFWPKLGMLFAPPRRRRAVATALAIFVSLWLLVGSLTVYAARDAVPGEMLYPLKRTTEQVQINLATDEMRIARLHLMFAGRRLQETAALLPTNQEAAVKDAVGAYQDEMDAVLGLLEQTTFLTSQEQETLAQLLLSHLDQYQTQIDDLQVQALPTMQPFFAAVLTTSRQDRIRVFSLMGYELPPEETAVPITRPTNTATPTVTVTSTVTPEPTPTATPVPSQTPTPQWQIPSWWPPECPVPPDWPEIWPEDCPIPTAWPEDWPEPPGGWPVPSLPTLLPTITWMIPSDWPEQCPIPPDWPPTWPEDCPIPTAWPSDWPELPEEWSTPPPPPSDDGWVDSPDELPPPPTEWPEEFPPPESWPTPSFDNDDEPPPWWPNP